MRTTITACPEHPHHVTVTTDSAYDTRRETTEYHAPSAGGYVHIADGLGQRPQVCDGLRRFGDTLYWSPRAELLVTLIRREYRRGRRMLAREIRSPR